MFAVLAALNLLTLPLVYGIFRLRQDIAWGNERYWPYPL
jgi:hypothetical protein